MKRGFRLDFTFVGAALLLATTSLLTTASLAHDQEERIAVGMSTDTVHVATPTGERVTDRDNIQAAFDAVQPGGTVIFAAGSYVVGGEGLVLRTPGVALRGDADDTTFLGCTRKQRMDLSAREFSEVCGDGFVLAAEAQRVSGLRFESFSLTLNIREATEVEEQGRSASFTGGGLLASSSDGIYIAFNHPICGGAADRQIVTPRNRVSLHQTG